VGKQKDEELKAKIVNTYIKYHKESSSDRKKVYLEQLRGLAFNWCRDHLFYRERYENEAITYQMGVEIVEEVRRCAEKNKTPEEFMEDLKSSLYNAKKLFYRNKTEGALRESRIIKDIKKIIATEEANEGRKLTQDERVNRIRRFIPMREETIREHLKSMDRVFINYVHDYDDEDELVESMAGHSLTTKGPVSDPQNEAMEDSEAEIIKDALETVLNEYQDKMKPFYRALFTMRCVKEIKNYQRLMPALNGEILEMFQKNGKLPAQYEIYMKYHPLERKNPPQKLMPRKCQKSSLRT